MSWLRLNALATGSMTTTILLAAITGYLLILRGKDQATRWLAGYLGSLFLLLLAYTVRYSVFSTAALATGQASNLIVFGVACLIQFAYWFGGNPYLRESRVVLVVSFVAALLVWGRLLLPGRYQPVYDFHAEYFTYDYGPSVSILSLAEYLWALVVFLRRAAATGAGGSGRSLARRFLRPEGMQSRSHRSFALLTVATLPIALQYVLFQTGLMARATYVLVFNTGSLLICLLIFIVYLNNAPHPTTFAVKLVALPTSVLMVAFGIASNFLMPVVERTIIDRYRAEARLAGAALETQQLSRLPRDVAYLLPSSSGLDSLRYGPPRLFRPSELLRHALPGGRTSVEELPAARFHYYALDDTSTFFVSFPLQYLEERYSVGFSYADYRLQVHEFAGRLALVALGAFAVVVVGFPLFYRRGLLVPLATLLEAVGRVSRGNFRQRIPPGPADEIGRLAEGYNRMIEALKNLEGNFKALAENAYDAILILSERGEVLFANDRAGRLIGRPAGRLVGAPLADLFDGISPLAGPREDSTREATALRSDGTRVAVEAAIAATRWGAGPARVLVARDVSERKQAEALLRSQQLQLMRTDKLSSLGELVAAVAHEINNPNHIVAAGARFIEEGIPGLFAIAESSTDLDESVRIAGKPYAEFKEACRRTAAEIARSARRIDHIVGELKRFVHGSTPQRTAVDVNAVVASVLDLARYTIEQASTRFEVDLAESPLLVCGDFVELEQVVLNLLENACQSLPPSGGEVSVRTRFDAPAQEIEIEVADTGCGMSASELAQAVEPFFTSRGERGGTGLGLSVAGRIVAGLGGRLSFDSSPGRGTRASVRLLPTRDPPPV